MLLHGVSLCCTLLFTGGDGMDHDTAVYLLVNFNAHLVPDSLVFLQSVEVEGHIAHCRSVSPMQSVLIPGQSIDRWFSCLILLASHRVRDKAE